MLDPVPRQKLGPNAAPIALSGDRGRVRRWRGARRVRCACPLTFAVALSPAPIGPSPPPALRTGTCGFPASGSPVGSCISHAERRFGALLAVPAALPAPVPRSCTASPARCLSPTRRQTCSRPDGTEPPFSPAPSLTHVMLRNSPPLHAGFVGKATPAGLRSSVIPPHLRPLSSTGITPRLQYYGPLRHPAGPACPSRGPGCRVHGTGRASRVALRLPSSMHAGATTPAETGRCPCRSLPGQSAAFPFSQEGRLPQHPYRWSGRPPTPGASIRRVRRTHTGCVRSTKGGTEIHGQSG